jgi:hypothetical protein
MRQIQQQPAPPHRPMAKLTLSFKGRLLSVHHLDEHPVTVGRDAGCGVCIDSLAVAPRQAELVPSDSGWLLLGLDSDYPLLLNNEQVDQASLHHGDEIRVGKHTLLYSDDSTLALPRRPRAEPPPPPAVENQTPGAVEVVDEDDEQPGDEPVPAYLQVQSGPKIGRVIAFRRSVTRLNRVGADDVIVTRQGDYYHLLRLGGQTPVHIDGIPITADGEIRLNDNALIEIGELRLRFFSGRTREAASEA